MTLPINFRSLMVFEDVNIVENQANPQVSLVQPVLNFLVPFLPTQLSFCVFAAVSDFKPEDVNNVEIVITNELTKEDIMIIPWQIEQIEQPTGITSTGIMISNIRNLIIPNEGQYTVSLKTYGEVLGTTYFEVFPQPQKMETNNA
ncbi:hypothetical protein [Paenibacillus sp. ACRRY]|uniref:hypothetical protein n=1 Tax=Paenibacillus sp. ACRRY TaxID=2918208 RepID=UPI001EF6A0A1|nr:hypothetical protein [Paenibacillus sp. ACRRY]MCG7385123.1 hypothetical protein [Paenibacillus sp. ACRRY]